ncbi:hypothetical protein HRD68_00865 (plasmid) [Yersinia massiliensis]|uniref:hypothetical protein n=1 Tax=Yersinia massiliensis TaxID=419257 RepID=UPI001562E71E|nr:hypothetical protein [Yersinia massiliensis]QKJ09408.1 hypothetical protein HRD68_00865 [Yersinia massiliensis]
MIMGFFKKRSLRKRLDKLYTAISETLDVIESSLIERVFLDDEIDRDRLRAISVAGVLFACSSMRELYGNDELIGKSLFFACLKFAPLEMEDLSIDLSIELNHPSKDMNPGFWPSNSYSEGQLEHVYMTLVDMSPLIGKYIISHL